MESRMSVSPLPAQHSVPVPHAQSPRKRSIEEITDPTEPSSGHKRPIHNFSTENQENRDPSLAVVMKDSPNSQEERTALPHLSVEISPARNGDSAMISGPKETTPACVSIAETNSSQPAPSGSPAMSESTSTPAAKKRKLSPASQSAKQQEKEARDRQKLEEKAKKEEEKRLKAEEKKKRDEEREEEKKKREEKRKAKDEERAAKEAAKEEEKRRKEEERLKKERAQPKLNSFFAKPAVPSAANKSTLPATSISPKKSTSTTTDPHPSNSSESAKSDYEKAFPEFFLQSHTRLAPLHRFERDPQALQHVRATIDASLSASTSSPPNLIPFRPSEIFHIIPFHRRCGRPAQSVKDIVLHMQNAPSESMMDLDGSDQFKAAEEAQKTLQRIPMKTLKFSEDVRPPYQGTFTRPVPEVSARKLARNPFHRCLPEVNYDYDSEAEWEEPEDGEDIDSDGDEEESDDDDDDMGEFLDDEDDALLGSKRRPIVGDLEPVCSGLRWAADGVDAEMKVFQIQTISDAVKFPIDPFSTAYWEKAQPAEPVPTQTRMAPPGINTLDAFRVVLPPSSPAAAGAARPPAPGKAKRPFPPEQLGEFRQVVESSELSKIGTIEILKKRFPKIPKDTLKATLDQYAVRVGQKETDKKWVWR